MVPTYKKIMIRAGGWWVILFVHVHQKFTTSDGGAICEACEWVCEACDVCDPCPCNSVSPRPRVDRACPGTC